MNSDLKSHWENIYSSKKEDGVSWFQEHPKTSIDLIEKYSTDIISDNFTFVGSKSDSSDGFTPKSQDNNDFSNQDIIKDEDIPF